jgi:hypothetical protein
MNFQRELDPDEQSVIDNIRDHGCHIMHVFDDKGELPEFSYSIGFPVSVGQAEVIVFGLKREVRHWMVNEVCRQCAEGLKLTEGLRISGLVEGFDCVARLVRDPGAIREYFGWAIWFHETQRGEQLTEVYQLVWPGAVQGLFPWDEGCDEDVIELQLPLYDLKVAS